MDIALRHPEVTAATASAFRLLDRVTIARRFNGPRRFANGGYAAGRFAAGFSGPTRVILRRPVPLGRALEVRADGRDGARVSRHGRLIAEVAPADGFPSLEPPVVPTLDDADAAMSASPWADVDHPLAECVVCAPHRPDGLGITPGPLAGRPGILAATFHSHSGLATVGNRDVVAAEFVWAALDCPSYPAEHLLAGRVALLGTTAVRRHREVYVGESLVVVGWTLGGRRRSVRTAAALLDADGDVVAEASNIWVAVPRLTAWTPGPR